MARYDVYANSRGPGFLLDVQSDLLANLSTRVVVPLLPQSDQFRLPGRLNPVFDIDGKPYTMLTNLLAAVPLQSLAKPRTNLTGHHDQITGALDMLFHGF